jgi:hypothetical protein
LSHLLRLSYDSRPDYELLQSHLQAVAEQAHVDINETQYDWEIEDVRGKKERKRERKKERESHFSTSFFLTLSPIVDKMALPHCHRN